MDTAEVKYMKEFPFYLLDIVHPLCHLLVTHVIDIFDEGVVLLPERHLDQAVRLCCYSARRVGELTLVISLVVFL